MQKIKPKISVVLPCYNRQDMIHHAIQSIMDQTFDDWELIVVDDGSTDRSVAIIKPYLKDPRVKLLINKKNRGISYTRNRGNKLAKADWIVVQDSDDMSLPDRLQHYWDYIRANPDVDYIYHQHYVRAIDIHYGVRAVHRELYKPDYHNKKRALTHPTIPAFACYKKKTVLKYPYRLNIGYWDDWMLIMDFTLNDKKFGLIERPLYEYVISDSSITIQSDRDGSREQDSERIKNILRKEYKLTVE